MVVQRSLDLISGKLLLGSCEYVECIPASFEILWEFLVDESSAKTLVRRELLEIPFSSFVRFVDRVMCSAKTEVMDSMGREDSNVGSRFIGCLPSKASVTRGGVP